MNQTVLNPEQQKAVHHKTGPLLIIAGAGTGKTTVITERISHLIKKIVKPSEILALTFTEKAAREMEERVDISMPFGYTQMWISTFHSFCDRILRNDAIHIGLTSGYKLLSQAEAVSLFRKNIFSFNLEYFRPLGNPNKFISGMLTHFSRLKDEDVSSTDYRRWLKIQNSKLKVESENTGKELELKKWQELAHTYEVYELLKIKNGYMDFGDLISNTLVLFRKRPNILSSYQSQFKYILVDEFQDTNIAQYELIKLLAPYKNNPNLTVVGDDSQSIYKFRGAAISNILSFMKDYKKAKQVLLNQNYRSTQTILDNSHKLIKFNDPDTLEAQMGISKKLTAVRQETETPVELLYEDRVENEAEEVVKSIEHESTESNRKWKDFAILVRANNHADSFMRALRRRGIPYQFLGPGMLFRQDEVKDLICYLKILQNPEDSVSLYRLISMNIWNISGRDISSLSLFSKKYSISLFESCELVAGLSRADLTTSNYKLPFLSQSGKDATAKIIEMILRHLGLVSKETAGQILFYFLEDSGIIKQLTEYETVADERRAQNISKFFDKLKTYEIEHEDASIGAVVDWIDLSFELGESPVVNDTDWFDNNAVNILTIHSSKGLEFPVVYVVNLISGRFPTYERREQIPIPDEIIKESLPEGDFHIEEERRLFYVAMTRARDKLFFTASKYYGEGKRERKLSSFVAEALGEKRVSIYEGRSTNKEKQLSFFDYQKPEKSQEESSEKKQIFHRPIHPITYLSYSQIETFKFCPLHYKAKYILKIPTPTYAAATFGKTLHDTLKYFYQGIMSGEKWSTKELLDIYQKTWNPAGFDSRVHMEAMKKLGKEHLADFMNYFHKKEPKPIGIEKPFIFSVSPSLKIGGVIDRINVLPTGEVEIIDYKTSAKLPTQKDVDTNLQLTVYALSLLNVEGLAPVKDANGIILSLYFFKDHTKISTRRTAQQLDKVKEEIIKIAKDIEASDFACSGNTWCKTCEYKMLCSVD
jgi:DNA helicase-2/ATP-dependent DNA helicase PcrA